MEMGERASLIEQVAGIEHDDSCYFCNAAAATDDDKNDLDDEDENYTDGPPGDGVVFKNCAAKLGSKLRATGDFPPESDPYIFAAHHLIPGNASFKKSDLYMSKEYVIEDGNKAGNIGYDINAAPNGVWLPGNYGQENWTVRTEQERAEFAFKIMRETNRQFHDAHGNYNEFILEVLQKIYDKLEDAESPEAAFYCPKSKQDETKPTRALKGLVSRLNTVSRRMAKFLTGPAETWRHNIFTSRFAPLFMAQIEKESAADAIKGATR